MLILHAARVSAGHTGVLSVTPPEGAVGLVRRGYGRVMAGSVAVTIVRHGKAKGEAG